MATRRFGLYFAWDRVEEYASPAGKPFHQQLGILENRYPSLFEFRRMLWPDFEHLSGFRNQSISGFFDAVILQDFELFGRVVKEVTGNPVEVIQRRMDVGPTKQLDDSIFGRLDTLIVVSLDHSRTRQVASLGEIDAIRAFLGREGRCVVICPHHDIGSDDSLDAELVEFRHHGDPTIPARQRLGGFARSLLAGLGVPVQNKFGLSPARAKDGSPAPLTLNLDFPGATDLLTGVTTFNLHPHLPQLDVAPEYRQFVDVLVHQPINPSAPRHVFTDAGNRSFNALLRVYAPALPGLVLVCDATLWSAAFGGLSSLQAFWRNLAKLPLN